MTKRNLIIGCAGIALVLVGLLCYGGYRAGRFVAEAQGMAIYSGLGAHERLLEYAKSVNNEKYIAHVEKTVSLLRDEISNTENSARVFGLDMAKLEAARKAAYKQIDKNIKEGQNPLAYLDEPEG